MTLIDISIVLLLVYYCCESAIYIPLTTYHSSILCVLRLQFGNKLTIHPLLLPVLTHGLEGRDQEGQTCPTSTHFPCPTSCRSERTV